MKHQLDIDKKYTALVNSTFNIITSVVFYFYAAILFSKFTLAINLLSYPLYIVMLVSIFSIVLVSSIFVIYTIYGLSFFNKKLDRFYLCYRFFKPYSKNDINTIYLDESIDIDLIYYKLIPYSKYKNDETIDQHINIDRLLKQRRPLDMKYDNISFSENEMAIFL